MPPPYIQYFSRGVLILTFSLAVTPREFPGLLAIYLSMKSYHIDAPTDYNFQGSFPTCILVTYNSRGILIRTFLQAVTPAEALNLYLPRKFSHRSPHHLHLPRELSRLRSNC
jgi:hypothetical protein